MDANNLAIVFAPNLLKPPGNDASNLFIITDMGHLIELVTTMIVDVETLFIKESFAEDKTRAFKKTMQKKYSCHSIASLKALEKLKKDEANNKEASTSPSWNDKISFIKDRLQSGDSAAASTFFDQLEEAQLYTKTSQRQYYKHIRHVSNRRIQLANVFQELSNSLNPVLLTQSQEMTTKLDKEELQKEEEGVVEGGLGDGMEGLVAGEPAEKELDEVENMVGKMFSECDEKDGGVEEKEITTLVRKLTQREPPPMIDF